MEAKQAQAVWYAKNTSADQALIIDEGNGRNIAVAYDKKDGPLLAAAPEMLEALKEAYSTINQLAFLSGDKLAITTLNEIDSVISKAEGRQ